MIAVGQFMKYKSVSVPAVENVELISAESEEWMKYKRSLFDKDTKTSAQREREQTIRSNENEFRRFQKDAEFLLEDATKLVEKLTQYIEHRKQAQFNPIGKNEYGNELYATPDPDYEKYNIIKNTVHWKKVNYNRETQNTEVYSKARHEAMQALRQHGYTVVKKEEYRSPEKYALPRFYDKTVQQLRPCSVITTVSLS